MVKKRKAGPVADQALRFPCGKRRTGDPRAGNIWQRIQQGIVAAADERLGTEVARLAMRGDLTPAQANTAFMIGEVYGRYERAEGRSRSTRSPSYQTGRGAAGREIPLTRVKADWIKLQDNMPFYPAEARSTIEALCVENRSINPTLFEDVRALLDRIAGEFDMGPKRGTLKTHRAGGIMPLRRVPKAQQKRPEYLPGSPDDAIRKLKSKAEIGRHTYRPPGSVPRADAHLTDPLAAEHRAAAIEIMEATQRKIAAERGAE